MVGLVDTRMSRGEIVNYSVMTSTLQKDCMAIIDNVDNGRRCKARIKLLVSCLQFHTETVTEYF